MCSNHFCNGKVCINCICDKKVYVNHFRISPSGIRSMNTFIIQAIFCPFSLNLEYDMKVPLFTPQLRFCSLRLPCGCYIIFFNPSPQCKTVTLFLVETHKNKLSSLSLTSSSHSFAFAKQDVIKSDHRHS